MAFDETFLRYKCDQRDDDGAQNCPFDLFVPAWIGSVRCPYHGQMVTPYTDNEHYDRTWASGDIPSGSLVVKASIVGW